MRRAVLWIAAFLVTPTLSAAADAPAWSWPDKPMNLKVLGGDVTGRKLGMVMRGFTRGLGVHCAHCHVGEEGKPLSTYDFASDENPNKDRAREMMRMLAEIDGHLQKIEPSGPSRVEMGCVTCHRGRPRPTTLQEEMRDAYKTGGAAGLSEAYAELRRDFYGRGGLDFGPRGLDDFGHGLLVAGDTAGALAVFRLNSEQNPESSDVWASLAGAYAKDGQKEVAEIYFRKALEIDPENEDALESLRALSAAPEPAKP